MPAKALAPLISALPKAPRDLQLNQKLAALHTRAGRFSVAGVCCRTLESIYHDAGHADEASRYADLAAKYEESGGTASTPAAREAAVAAVASAAPEFEVSGFSHESVVDAAEVAAATESYVTPPAAVPSGLFFHASAPTAPPAVASGAVAPEAAAPEAAEPAAGAAQQESAVDLSNEWEQDLQVEAPQRAELSASETVSEKQQADAEEEVPVPLVTESAPVVSNLDESIDEVRFYLGQGMTEQAEQLLVKLEALAPESPDVAVLRLSVDSAKQAVAPPEPEQEISINGASSVEEPSAVEEAQATPTSTPQPWPQERPVLQEMVSEIEQSLGDGFLAEPEKAPAPEPAPETVSAQGSEFRSGTLDDFVSDLEASLGGDFLPPTAVAPAALAQPAARIEVPAAMAAAAAAAPASLPPIVIHPQMTPAAAMPVQPSKPEPIPGPGPGVDLSEMFGELKLELESGVTGVDEDPETHYNLGVAFREMGLLDEAIGELQKVVQAVEHGHPFAQMIQTYTWLAQCFLDKGVPEVAVRWFEKALQLPSLDQETRTALHYELGSSFETAGDKPAALSNFLQAYGSNIDYRDVAERIKALRP
jgi:tetratricopeptide (TPR) repeat protein